MNENGAWEHLSAKHLRHSHIHGLVCAPAFALAPTVEIRSCASTTSEKIARHAKQIMKRGKRHYQCERLNLSWIRNVQCMHVWIAVEFIKCRWLFCLWVCMHGTGSREWLRRRVRKNRRKQKLYSMENAIVDCRRVGIDSKCSSAGCSIRFHKTMTGLQSTAARFPAN